MTFVIIEWSLSGVLKECSILDIPSFLYSTETIVSGSYVQVATI